MSELDTLRGENRRLKEEVCQTTRVNEELRFQSRTFQFQRDQAIKKYTALLLSLVDKKEKCPECHFEGGPSRTNCFNCLDLTMEGEAARIDRETAESKKPALKVAGAGNRKQRRATKK